MIFSIKRLYNFQLFEGQILGILEQYLFNYYVS